MAYLRGHFEPADEKDGKRMFQRARSYTIFEGELYKLGVVDHGSSVSPSPKVESCSRKITQAFVDPTSRSDPWCPKLSGKDSFGH